MCLLRQAAFDFKLKENISWHVFIVWKKNPTWKALQTAITFFFNFSSSLLATCRPSEVSAPHFGHPCAKWMDRMSWTNTYQTHQRWVAFFFSRLLHVTEGVIQRLVRDSVSCCSMMFVFRSLCRKEKQNHKNVNLVVSQKQHTLKFSKVATTAAWNLSLQSLIPGQVCSRPVFWELLRMTPPSAEDSHLSGLSLGWVLTSLWEPPYEWIKYIRLLLKSGLLFKDWFWCRLHRWLPLPVWTFHTRGHRSCFSLQPSA